MYKLIVLAALVAVALASGSPQFPEGDPAAKEQEVRNVLAYKQHEVNRQALYHGAGVGTAPYRGVPGTDLERNPGYYGYGHGHGYGPYAGGFYGYGAGYGYPYGAFPYGYANGAAYH